MERAIPNVRRAWCAAALVLAACAGGESGPDAVPNNSALRGPIAEAESGAARGAVAAGAGEATVLIAGTSLTAGLGLDPSDAYPAVLERMADSTGVPVRVVNGGLSGETSAGLLRRIGWLLREPADVVVIETGANDGLRGVDPDSTRANLRRIVEEVRDAQPSARVLLVQMEAPPNLGAAYTARFRGMYAEVAEETGAGLVPFLLEGIAGESSLNQADGIHPNEEGARRAAAIVWGALRPALDSLDRPVGGG